MAVAEAHFPAHGALGATGVVVMAVGAVLAISGLGAGLAVGLLGGLALAAAGATGLTLALKPGLEARRRRVRTGAEGIVGHVGVVRSWTDATGSVSLDGAVWHARRSPTDEDADAHELHRGDPVVVERLNGLTLCVRPAEDWELI